MIPAISSIIIPIALVKSLMDLPTAAIIAAEPNRCIPLLNPIAA